jgi:selenocysteine-specific elongation factor
VIIGTAGHIDHGKTALVKALTGVDTDRLKEEKARGITIDLGFAYLPIDGGETLGFIDVPGHERLVHTMLAGATGIDFVLVAVAADDGVKPQTLEHLAIIDLLDIRRGVVALTKADLVSAERLAAVSAEIRAVLSGTVLDKTEILPVSAVTGAGIAALRDHLAAAARDSIRHPVESRFRLAIDRCFIILGSGVVVTGTVLSGSVGIDDRVLISPSGLAARVRAIHAQNRPSDAGVAGDRCALNLAGVGIAKDAIRRGDVALDAALHAPTARIDASLRVLAGEKKPLGQWFPVHLHHGSAEIGARIVQLGDDALQPGATGFVQLVLDQPIAAASGDRYVVRDVSAQRTIGGGRFLDLRPPARRRRSPERMRQLGALALRDPADALRTLLSAPPYVFDFGIFARDHALSPVQEAALRHRLRLVVLEGDGAAIVFLPEQWVAFVAALTEQLAQFHADNPDLQGMGRERLRLALPTRLPAPVFVVALQDIARDGSIVRDGAFVRLSSHTVRPTELDETTWAAIAPLLGGSERFRPARVRDIANLLGRAEPDIRRLMKLMGRLGRIDEIAHDHFFLRPTVQEMVAIVADLDDRAPNHAFTAADFRDRVQNGRKVAIQILEFFDRHGVTIRRGDLRRANKHRLDLFGPIEIASASGRESSPVGRPDFKSGWGSEPVPGGFDSHSLPPRPSDR